MHIPRQLISITPWTAIETIAKDNIKDWSVSKARITSATKPHKSQMNGIFHAMVRRLYSVDTLYAPNQGEPTTHTNPNGSAVRNNACPRVISCSALPRITNARKTAMSPLTTTAVWTIRIVFLPVMMRVKIEHRYLEIVTTGLTSQLGLR